MKKDAYFFPHFCNARHDRKIKRVMKELGVEGYGIYFMLLEILREQIDFKYPVEDIDLLADEFGTSEQKVRAVITNYKLFEVDEEERFFSMKLVFYMQPYIEKSERARLAARKRWDNVRTQMIDANAYANVLPMQSESNADAMQGEESKGEESKEKDNNIEPFFEECWSLYPNKKGKGQIKPKRKKDAYLLGDEFKRCIERYKTHLDNNEWLKPQNGSTFWNGGYVDYLDNNCNEIVETSEERFERLFGNG